MQERPAKTTIPFAAVDLGSNSFHLVVARVLGDWVSIVDRLRDPVRLAGDLDSKGRLSAEGLERMITSLERFRQRLKDIPTERILATGTNTFRTAREPKDLLARAQEALGAPIQILSGQEEARLIYLGVVRELPPSERRRLVIDIGGGSTECILGRGNAPVHTDSLHMGCVSWSQRFFPDGKLTRERFKKAETAAKLELETLQDRFTRMGWTEAFGSSGTILAIGRILSALDVNATTIERAGLKRLRKTMIEAGSLKTLSLPALDGDRRPVLPGGLAILKATFDMLGVQALQPMKAALREGLLYQQIGRFGGDDMRETTVQSALERYHVDLRQAERVERVATLLFEDVRATWKLSDEDARFLRWAALLHEIGLAISYAGYHKHGAYILENSNLPGFSLQEKSRLALLVLEHRRKFRNEFFDELGSEFRRSFRRLGVLLRLAARLNRMRSDQPLPRIHAAAEGNRIELQFPPGWLEEHPLTCADLEDEAIVLGQASFELATSIVPQRAGF
ncbi:MAG: Ppx/GppA phosphatase family protein [Planctomycetota bacterium]